MKKLYYLLCLIIIFLLITKISFTQCHPDTVITIVNNPVTIDVRSNDTTIYGCNYTIDYSIFCCSWEAPQYGTVSILNWDSIRYFPNIDFIGYDTFLYAVNNDSLPNGACDTGRVFITVEPFFDLDTTNGGVNDTLYVSSLPVTLDAGVGFGSYLWSPGGGATQTIVATSTGWYSVYVFTYVSTGVIMQYDSIYVHLSSLQNSNENENSINMYPNPTNGKIYIEAEIIDKIEVFNIQGELVISQISKDKSQKRTVDITRIPEGVYLIKIITEKRIITQKIIKNKNVW